MPSENDGVMIVLSSPSGAGKTTLVKMLSKIDNYEISISHTTRQPRPNEKIIKIIILSMKMSLKD
jgi:guanylate kinase